MRFSQRTVSGAEITEAKFKPSFCSRHNLSQICKDDTSFLHHTFFYSAILLSLTSSNLENRFVLMYSRVPTKLDSN